MIGPGVMAYDMGGHMGGHHDATGPDPLAVLAVVASVVGVGGYAWAWWRARGRGRPTSGWNATWWVAGVAIALFSVTGPLAAAAHHDFTWHMVSHVLLGMVAPFLMALGRPVRLLLAAVGTDAGRRVNGFLGLGVFRVLTDPVVASVLNVGGLWLLYRTGLYGAMHQHEVLHLLVHVHMFLAGYLFTLAILETDPVPHRSLAYRAVAVVVALAAHDILAKVVYADPPLGVPAVSAERGAMLMYYGGDAVDVAIMALLCREWYRAARPRRRIRREAAGL